MVPYTTLQYNTIQYTTLHYTKIHYNILLCNKILELAVGQVGQLIRHELGVELRAGGRLRVGGGGVEVWVCGGVS